MGGDYEHICFAVKNMIANLTGMICDGAKPACSLKITSGVSTALLSALLAMDVMRWVVIMAIVVFAGFGLSGL